MPLHVRTLSISETLQDMAGVPKWSAKVYNGRGEVAGNEWGCWVWVGWMGGGSSWAMLVLTSVGHTLSREQCRVTPKEGTPAPELGSCWSAVSCSNHWALYPMPCMRPHFHRPTSQTHPRPGSSQLPNHKFYVRQTKTMRGRSWVASGAFVRFHADSVPF